jgi:hypothetical protein
VHTPLNDATRGLLCAATLAQCKKGVFVINAARGGIINEADLLAALESGHVRGAAVDVFDAEPPTSAVTKALIAHPGVVCTPHLGASTEEAQKKVARDIAAQMSDAFAGRAFVGVVNAPHVALAHRPAFAAYATLAEALGSMQGQIALAGEAGALRGVSVRVDVEGPALQERGFAELALALVLKGLLPAVPRLDVAADAVNMINAPFVAQDAGINVLVRASARAAGAAFANVIRVTVQSPAGTRVALGAVIEGKPRIVQLDHWQSFPSFAPAGHLLLWNNIDAPGQVALVTRVLAEHNINVASLAVARQFEGGGSPALSVMLCDSRIPTDAVNQINALKGASRLASWLHRETHSFTRALTYLPPAPLSQGITNVRIASFE